MAGGRRLPGIGKFRGDYADLRYLRASPERPPAGSARLFVKPDGTLAWLKDDGTETAVGSGGGVTVKEVDGTPNVAGVTTIRVSNGTLTDDGGGQVTVTTGGGGGLTDAYVGYNTVGASSEAPGNLHVLATKITTTGAVILQNVAIHATENGGNVTNLMVGLWADNSSTLGKLLAQNSSGPVDSIARDATYGWIAIPLIEKLAASTSYWIGVMMDGGVQIKYDTSGSDRTMTSGGWWLPDGSIYTQTDTTKKYSIRGLTIA